MWPNSWPLESSEGDAMKPDGSATSTSRPRLIQLFVVALLMFTASACGQGSTSTFSAGASEAQIPAASTDLTQGRLRVDGAKIDVHAHLASQTLADVFGGGGPALAEDLIAQLDEANVDQAVVLSGGYFGWPVGFTDDFNMAPENDFVATEVVEVPEPSDWILWHQSIVRQRRRRGGTLPGPSRDGWGQDPHGGLGDRHDRR